MKREYIDLYLTKMKSGISEEEKKELSKRIFFDVIKGNIFYYETLREVDYSRNMDRDLIKYFIESGALNLCHIYVFTEIVDASRILGKLITLSNASNKNEARRMMNSELEVVIFQQDFLGENPSKEIVQIYDGILYKYIYDKQNAKSANTLLEKKDEDAVRKFFDRIPDGINKEDTIFYSMQEKRQIIDGTGLLYLLPHKSKEEYEQMLSSLVNDRTKKVTDPKQYDSIAYHYLVFYGDTEIDTETKCNILENIYRSIPPGELFYYKVYREYLVNSNLEENQMVLNGFSDLIVNDILARLYEPICLTKEFITRYEWDLFKKLYLPRYWDPDQKKIVASEKDGENVELLPGELECHLKSLFYGDSTTRVECAKYIIRLKQKFTAIQRPRDIALSTIYDYVIGLDLFEILKENLDDTNLRDYDPNEPMIDMEYIYKFLGKEYTDKDRLEYEQRYLYTQQRHRESDLNINSEGWRRIDAADIAISLMIEADFDKGFEYLISEENIEKFSKCGKSIYDSKAASKIVELYVDDPSQFNNVQVEEFILKYIDRVMSNPNFNLFNERSISDLLQIVVTEDSDFSKKIELAINQKLDSDLNQKMSIDEANKIIANFMTEYEKKPIDESSEEDLDKFLQALNRHILSQPKFVFSQEITDFLIKQIIDSNSLINKKREKYFGVAERTVENFGKLDHISLFGLENFKYKYLTRDYIDYFHTTGLRKSNKVVEKTTMIEQLFEGELYILKNAYHENTHIRQISRLNQLRIESYNEYMMIKETCIRLVNDDSDYYEPNYFYMLNEIEAREVAAQKTADYIKNTLLPNSVNKGTESLIDNSSDVNRYQEMADELEKESKETKRLYEKGINEKSFEGKTQTINDIFEEQHFQESQIRHFLSVFPALVYEYNLDGTRKTLIEQIVYADMFGEKINLSVLRELIRNGTTVKEDKQMSLLNESLPLLIKTSSQEKREFFGGIIQDNLSVSIQSYKKELKEGNESSKIIAYLTYTNIQNILHCYEENPNLPWMKFFSTPDSEGRTGIEKLAELQEYIKPKIQDMSNEEVKRYSKEISRKTPFNQSTKPYDQLKTLAYDPNVSVKEKRKAQMAEQQIKNDDLQTYEVEE